MSTPQLPSASVSPARPEGLERIRTLWRLWRNEREDPEPFYSLLAAEAADDLAERYGPMQGRVIADIGCGPGYYARAFVAAGAQVIAIDGATDEMGAADAPPPGAVVADAAHQPLPTASVDGAFCSNLLEHARDTDGVIRELERITRPGGWVYLSWTNWYSPWGGHDMTPYHLLGPERGPKLYEKRHGPPRKNRYGEGLFAVHIGPTLRLVEARPGLEIERVEPRYYPWASFIMHIPGVREVLSWNCVIRCRRV